MYVVAPGEIDDAARPLAEAFASDPLQMFLFGGPLPIGHALRLFRAFIGMQLRFGHVYTAVDYGATAIWSPPGCWKIPTHQVLQHSLSLVHAYGLRSLRNVRVLRDLEELHPTEPHYYLEFVGTAPAVQRRGYASALIQPMLARADAEDVGVYLENANAANLDFFGRCGFEVMRTMHHRHDGPQQWLMWRDPR